MKKFKCVTCGGNRLEEVMDGITQSSEIQSVDIVDGTIICEYKNSSTDGGDIDSIYYQCMDCGKEVCKERVMSLSDMKNTPTLAFDDGYLMYANGKRIGKTKDAEKIVNAVNDYDELVEFVRKCADNIPVGI